MKQIKLALIALCFMTVLTLCMQKIVNAYGYDFIFPSARRSAVSGWTYADPDLPSHLAWDYRFPMHTSVAAAQSGWVANTYWEFDDGHETLCEGLVRDRGNYIILNHTYDDRTEGTGLETWYFHLSNTGAQPAAGDYFDMGEAMASSGDTGCGSAHLHVAAKLDNAPFDPYAGSTQWVSGQPIPMGYRDQDHNIHGPFAIDNSVIYNRWMADEGAAGPPIEDDWIRSCIPEGEYSPQAALFTQAFEHGYIYYCGSGSADYHAFEETPIEDIRARYTCGVGENSFLVITNTSLSDTRLTLTVFNGDGSIRDSRVHHSLLAPDEQWIVSIHEIVYDWLN